MRRTLSRLLLAAALALTVTPASAAGAVLVVPARGDNDIAWETLPYYSVTEEFRGFSIPTSGDTFRAREVGSPQSGFSFSTATPESQAEAKGLHAIWKPSCPATKPQRATFSREVYLPGPPGVLLVNLQMFVLDPKYHHNKNAISWAELRLNGVTLARVERGRDPVNRWSRVDATEQAGVVRAGENTITVVAQKSATPTSWHYCWNKPRGIPTFGVAAEFVGVPQADVRLTIPDAESTAGRIDVQAVITNHGPSAAVGRGSWQNFFFEAADGNGSAKVTSLALESPAGPCTTTQFSDSFHGTCPLPDLLPQHTVTIQVHVTIVGTCPYSAPTYAHVFNAWDLKDSGNTSVGTISC